MSAEEAKIPTNEKVEELSDDDEAPGLEAPEQPETVGEGKRQNRGEKKIRKYLAKTGLKELSGFNKVTFRQEGKTLFMINDPDVFKSPSGEIYVIFGEAKVDNSAAALSQAAASGLANDSADVPSLVADETPAAATETAATPATAEGASGDSEFTNKDIELVMAQGSCTREKAIAALRATKGDIVTAIMELTMQQ